MLTAKHRILLRQGGERERGEGDGRGEEDGAGIAAWSSNNPSFVSKFIAHKQKNKRSQNRTSKWGRTKTRTSRRKRTKATLESSRVDSARCGFLLRNLQKANKRFDTRIARNKDTNWKEWKGQGWGWGTETMPNGFELHHQSRAASIDTAVAPAKANTLSTSTSFCCCCCCCRAGLMAGLLMSLLNPWSVLQQQEQQHRKPKKSNTHSSAAILVRLKRLEWRSIWWTSTSGCHNRESTPPPSRTPPLTCLGTMGKITAGELQPQKRSWAVQQIASTCHSAARQNKWQGRQHNKAGIFYARFSRGRGNRERERETGWGAASGSSRLISFICSFDDDDAGALKPLVWAAIKIERHHTAHPLHHKPPPAQFLNS